MFSTTPTTFMNERRAMSATRDRDLLRRERGRGDHEHLGLREHPREAHLDVAGAGRHVDEEVVHLAPPHVGEELLDRLGQDRGRAT